MHREHLGANDTIKKPFGPQELLDAVSSKLTGEHPARWSVARLGGTVLLCLAVITIFGKAHPTS
jgi:DNA-binding response OmpR family regulator